MPLITGPVGIDRDEATRLLRQHKRERLPDRRRRRATWPG